MNRLITAILLSAVCLAQAAASTISWENKICPVCLSDIGYRVALSGSVFDTRLDWKPLGMIMAPGELPVCDNCGFVVFESSASASRLAEYRKITDSREYRKIRGRASYFKLGFLLEKLGERNELTLAMVALEASWQEEADPIKLKEDLELSLSHFNAYLPVSEEGSLERLHARLLRAELLRRLGRFDEAKKELSGLRVFDSERAEANRKIIKYERILCSRKDPSPRSVGEMERRGLFLKIKDFFLCLF